MSKVEILGLVISLLGFILFAIVFTIAYRSFTRSYIKDIKALKEDQNILEDLIKYNHPSYKKRRKIIKAIKNVIFYGLIIILVPFFMISLVSRIRGNVLMFGGKGYLVVASGSMSKRNNSYIEENNLNNQFDTGDIIQIKKLSSTDELKLYDVISFRNDKGINIIHRIIKINDDGTYITRGDSNLGSDTYHPTRNDVYGVYTSTKIPKLGYLIMFFKSNFGIMTMVAVVYCIFMIDYFNKKSGERYNKRYDEIEKLVNSKNLDYSELFLQLEDEELDYEGILGHKIEIENESPADIVDDNKDIESAKADETIDNKEEIIEENIDDEIKNPVTDDNEIGEE